MASWPVHARITGPIVMIGFGSIGRGTLPLIERHFEYDRARTTVIDPVDTDREMLDAFDPNLPVAEITADWVRNMLRGRKRRAAIFGAAAPFGDPVWDILLELYAAELSNERPAISEVCKGGAVPYTTALRWVGHLEDAGLLVRTPDPEDRRRVFVKLSAKGFASMSEYFGRGASEARPT